MMYMIFIIDHIHHLINKPKILIFIYNSDWRVYVAMSMCFLHYTHSGHVYKQLLLF